MAALADIIAATRRKVRECRSQTATAALLLFSAASFSQAPTNCGALIDKVFQVTGTQQEIADLPEFGLQFAQNMGSKMDPTAMRAFRRALAPEPWLKELSKAFEQDCNTAMLQDVISAMDTPMGARMREVERTEQGPATAQARANFYRDLRLHPPGDTRDQLAVRIEKATEAPEMSWDVVEATSRAVSKANRTSVSDTDVAVLRQKFQPILQSAVLLDVLFIYRNVSDDELEQYARALETASFRKFNHTLNEAIANTFATRIATALTSVRKSTVAKGKQ
jgi:hypothetical protein